MHELAIAQGIIGGACEHAAGRQIFRVTVAVGTLCAVVPDALRFCFELAAEGTLAEGAELIIEQVPARGHCHRCERDFTLHEPIPLCDCGSADVGISAGTDLRIRSMEVSDPCALPADAAATARR
ncbi:hydrogenase maturation nickel metallochaperone HypA [Nocardia sp. CA2R105]|uniref:hydrogenase maturation nickel metallochaperone HypA/HybF n=1 Tax=Nocardia coffeae TaxID=2873381 RepID=UPI001CA67273|nr:hydrogenase maturation nickel metallochaperone HypA [Nocardia coffeae]MBY8859923.1 hydrogenase maturation nickel metallochaperone HypA [Nocardia coffeae]